MQGREGLAFIEKPVVGGGLHGQLDVALLHESRCDARRDPDQVGVRCVPQGVDTERPSVLVAALDTRAFEVSRSVAVG
jgi:hypothetical protein